MNQPKPVNNYENGAYLCHCLKTGQSETIWRKSSESLACLPLSYIEIPFFLSMRKGNLQKNIIAAYFK